METTPNTRPIGLSGEDWFAMNDYLPDDEREIQYTQMRARYADMPYALEQIDVFDKSSPYGQALKEYTETFKSSDPERQAEIEAWFK